MYSRDFLKYIWKNKRVSWFQDILLFFSIYLLNNWRFISLMKQTHQIYNLQFTIWPFTFVCFISFLVRQGGIQALMRLIPLATKSLRHKDVHRRFRFIGKVKKINKISLVNLSDFVTLWRNNFLQTCYLFHIVLYLAIE